ncbi:MAG: gliding motility lipoprotein GldH [Lunatimonas sp.]|uniref:gliding motility lipoprotein GldH n=1 Tax=Lunatimonas sp. TaxID=2060141 RepID=UPI00263BB9A7|nr:gliding motility lipoprotein GldH [Lunatimonas sp.]MCC5939104.1 gliding motility lipoprotein GldH [Lunatimonas sp.]
MIDRFFLLGLFLLVTGGLVGCDSDRLYESYHDFPNPNWHLEDSVTFQLDRLPESPFHQVVSVRFTDRYEFHNLYLKMVIKDSTEQLIKDTLVNINLFDSKSGKPLGKGFGNRFTKYDTLTSADPALTNARKVQFIQYMRQESIEGIESIGLKLIRIPN